MSCIAFVTTVVFTLPFFYVYDKVFLQWNERRPYKAQLEDVVLNALPRVDTSLYISVMSTLECLVFGCSILLLDVTPWLTLMQFWLSFTLMHVMRMLCIWLCPLQAPHGGLILRDVFVEHVLFHGYPLRHDMFFSGHIGLNILFECYAPSAVTLVFYMGTFVMVMCLLLGAYHYSVDLLVGAIMAKQCVSIVHDYIYVYINSV